MRALLSTMLVVALAFSWNSTAEAADIIYLSSVTPAKCDDGEFRYVYGDDGSGNLAVCCYDEDTEEWIFVASADGLDTGEGVGLTTSSSSADETFTYATTTYECTGEYVHYVGGADSGWSGQFSIATGTGDDTIYGMEAIGSVTFLYIFSGGDIEMYDGYGAESNILVYGGDYSFVQAYSGDDYVSVEALYNLVYAGDGDDTVIAEGIENTIDLWAGNDYYLHEGGGHSDVTGGLGNDTIHGGPNADNLSGGTGNDHLYCEGGNDVCDGGSGTEDYVDGGKGADLCSGDEYSRNCEHAGDNVAEIYNHYGSHDFVFGREYGTPNLVVCEYNATWLTYFLINRLSGVNTSPAVVIFTDYAEVVRGYDADGPAVRKECYDTLNEKWIDLASPLNFENVSIQLQGGEDTFYGYDMPLGCDNVLRVEGGDGDDFISGTSGHDDLYGDDFDGTGEDTLYVLDGCGDTWANVAEGGGGVDYIWGGPSSDYLSEGLGDGDIYDAYDEDADSCNGGSDGADCYWECETEINCN